MKLKETKRDEATARKIVTDKLSAKDKLEKLDRRLGVGVGAKKERDRLGKLIGG
ncbi:hypothetical protein ACFLQL_00655 [Verrucomicrobiota bacterium]